MAEDIFGPDIGTLKFVQPEKKRSHVKVHHSHYFKI